MTDRRLEIIETAQATNALGINKGTAGNFSHRAEEGFFITPSGLPYRDCEPEDIVYVNQDGISDGRRKPSSEWRFHRDIYDARPEVEAIIHLHSPHATALACLEKSIPAFHYMVAVAGGINIRCAPYATFGTQELSERAVAALERRKACLLAHHGIITLGEGLGEALSIAIEVEGLAEMYLNCLQVTENPPVLGEHEMERVLKRFKTYGQLTLDADDDA
jgi:L-fuculose-phosphate aldolase